MSIHARLPRYEQMMNQTSQPNFILTNTLTQA